MGRKRWQYPALTEPDTVPAVEEITLDSWWQQPSEPVRSPARSDAALYAGTVLVEPVPPPVPEIGWLVEHRLPTFPPPPRLWQPIDLPWDETLWPITLDKWWIQQHNPILPLPRIQGYIVLLEFAVPPGVLVPFVFRECQALWGIVHPEFWESAATASGYISPAEYVPPPSSYISVEYAPPPSDYTEPAEYAPAPSGYIPPGYIPVPSGYIAPAEYVPAPSGYIGIECIPAPSGYIAKEDGTALWDMLR